MDELQTISFEKAQMLGMALEQRQSSSSLWLKVALLVLSYISVEENIAI